MNKFVYDPALIGLNIAQVMGDEVQVWCPYHSDTHPSAEYSLSKGLFYCFGCQTSKNAQQLADDLGGNLIPYQENTYTDEKQIDTLDWTRLVRYNKLALDHPYLRRRLVTNQQVGKFGLRASEDGIIFPLYHSDSTLVGAQVRHLKGQPKYKFYGERTEWYPFQQPIPRWPEPVFLVEGVFGVLRADLAGASAFACMGAGSWNQARNLLELTKARVYTVMDPDYAGRLAAGKMVLEGFATILTDQAPDDMSVSEWEDVHRDAHNLGTFDVMEVIYACDEPHRLERQLETYWKKLTRKARYEAQV